MRKVSALLVMGGFFLFAASVAAQPKINELTPKVAGEAGFNVANVRDTTLSETVGKIIRIALTFVGTIFLALTVYAGFLWMTAGGNEETVTKATGILKMATIGLIIVLAAYSLTLFVLYALTRATK